MILKNRKDTLSIPEDDPFRDALARTTLDVETWPENETRCISTNHKLMIVCDYRMLWKNKNN